MKFKTIKVFALNKKKNCGFSLIELLIVVAIIGALAAVGVVSYNGYTAAAKKSAAENTMQQIALMQTEYYSMAGDYYTGATCPPTEDKTTLINENVFDADEGESVIGGDGYNFCVGAHDTGYIIKSCLLKEKGGTVACDADKETLTLDAKGQNNF